LSRMVNWCSRDAINWQQEGLEGEKIFHVENNTKLT
jgi:hypothetical protein